MKIYCEIGLVANKKSLGVAQQVLLFLTRSQLSLSKDTLNLELEDLGYGASSATDQHVSQG